MKKQVLASTKLGYCMPKEEALDFSGKSAGICYLPDTVEKLMDEPKGKTLRRVKGNLESGHSSVFGHVQYTFCFEKIPKILAMTLNNEKTYNTSEKSARYTTMQASKNEEFLYKKWIEVYKWRITNKYPHIDPKKAEKLAKENARYLISVFTPATAMEYTVSFQQLNFIMSWMEDYIENEPDTPFSKQLKIVFKDFLAMVGELKVEGLNSRKKGTKLSLFATRDRKEEFGENYCTNYEASFAQLAQAQRHRTLSYEMSFLETNMFYVPEIIRGTVLEKEWLEDISSLAEYFPQGMLVKVNERGTVENFVLKCTERLCGEAQLEIMKQTKATLYKYLEATVDDPVLQSYLLPYAHGPRCTFPGWKCNKPCMFGKGALTRDI